MDTNLAQENLEEEIDEDEEDEELFPPLAEDEFDLEDEEDDTKT